MPHALGKGFMNRYMSMSDFAFPEFSLIKCCCFMQSCRHWKGKVGQRCPRR